MPNIPYESFFQYLALQGINQVEQFDASIYKDKNNIKEEHIKAHLCLISEFHQKSMGYTGYMSNRIENRIGKDIEQYKVNLKKLKKDIRNIQIRGCENEIEELLLNRGNEYVERGEKSISEIYNAGYIDIINRSMKWIELCLGDTSFDNIRKTEAIEIIDLNNCCYNVIEMDGYYFFNTLKKKKLELDWNEYVYTFCEIEKIEVNSGRFILALLSYPNQFIKVCNKYRENKRERSEGEYKLKFEKAILQDGKSFI